MAAYAPVLTDSRAGKQAGGLEILRRRRSNPEVARQQSSRQRQLELYSEVPLALYEPQSQGKTALNVL